MFLSYCILYPFPATRNTLHDYNVLYLYYEPHEPHRLQISPPPEQSAPVSSVYSTAKVTHNNGRHGAVPCSAVYAVLPGGRWSFQCTDVQFVWAERQCCKMCGQFEGLAFRPHAVVSLPIGASMGRTWVLQRILQQVDRHTLLDSQKSRQRLTEQFYFLPYPIARPKRSGQPPPSLLFDTSSTGRNNPLASTRK